MKILFYFGHPAQYLFAKPIIKELKAKQHQVCIAAKTKDVLTTLLDADKEVYYNILPEGRNSSVFSILMAILKRDFRLLKIALKFKPDVLVGSDSSIAHVGFLLRKKSITVLEDDYKVIKNLAKLTYPFSSCILTPEVCDVGKWTKKKVGYAGYMKLSYLHKNNFFPDTKKVNISEPYVMIRLANLNAHHDKGINGLNIDFVKKIIEICKSKHKKIIISSEKNVEDSELSKYILKINPSDIHHYLYYADLLISDSQSMSVEAAILGTPSIRFSDFAGQITVLEELEHTYQLTFGIATSQPEKLLEKAEELLLNENLKSVFKEKQEKMLAEKIDVAAFIVWFIENYPKSKKVVKENPNYQYNFK